MSSYLTPASYAVSLFINLMIMGILFAAGVMLILRLVQQLSPRIRYLIALSAFLAAAALPISSTFFVSRAAAVTLQVYGPIESEQQTPTAAIPEQGNNSTVDNSDGRHSSDQSHSLTDAPQRAGSIQVVPLLNALIRTSAESWLGVGFLALWVIVAALLLGKEVLGYIHLARARHSWRQADANLVDNLGWHGSYPLFISEHEGPCTVGLVRPAVVIPSRLLDEISLDAAHLIAMHELAHARWRDPLVNAFVRVVTALLWPSLPLLYLRRVVRAEWEAASDFYAVAGSHEDIKATALEYASLLLVVARRSSKESEHWKYQLSSTEAGSHVDLESRVARLLKISSQPTRIGVLFAAFALTATVWGAVRVPVAARPLAVTATAEESKVASFNQEAPTPHLSNIPAARDDILRSEYNDRPNQNLTEQETPRAESQLNIQDQIRDSAELMLTPQIAPATKVDVGQDFVSEMAALGYTNLSPDQLAAMKACGVSQAYIKEMADAGYDRLTADALINFRWLGISHAYIRDLNEWGYAGLSANTMIDFRLYGIRPAYINEMAALGFANLPAKTLVIFRRLGIDPEYVKALKARGDEHVSADQLIQRRSQEVIVESGKRGNAQND